MIKVIINGFSGKMGSEAVMAVDAENDMHIVAKTGRNDALDKAITDHKADVVVDLTHPESVRKNVETILRSGAHAVVGTTGLTAQDLTELATITDAQKKSCIICPNFSIGAILMMRFAAMAAPYLPDVEIIEYHHPKKADAPSGTSMKTADLIVKAYENVNATPINEKLAIAGVRGGRFKNIPIHSVRIPGVIADEDVIFGGLDQTLTLSHRTLSRKSFMPGILLAIREATKRQGLIYGLENVL